MRGRAFRRYQREKRKQQAQKRANRWFSTADSPRWTSLEEWEKSRQQWIDKHAVTPCTCSCDICGNPRHHWNEKTVQEMRVEQENYEDI